MHDSPMICNTHLLALNFIHANHTPFIYYSDVLLYCPHSSAAKHLSAGTTQLNCRDAAAWTSIINC